MGGASISGITPSLTPSLFSRLFLLVPVIFLFHPFLQQLSLCSSAFPVSLHPCIFSKLHNFFFLYYLEQKSPCSSLSSFTSSHMLRFLFFFECLVHHPFLSPFHIPYSFSYLPPRVGCYYLMGSRRFMKAAMLFLQNSNRKNVKDQKSVKKTFP